MIGCLRTRVRKQPIIALYFESEPVLKFYNLEARLNKTECAVFKSYRFSLYLKDLRVFIMESMIPKDKKIKSGQGDVLTPQYTGMRKFRIDQDFLIEQWHMIYIMSVVFAEIYV